MADGRWILCWGNGRCHCQGSAKPTWTSTLTNQFLFFGRPTNQESEGEMQDAGGLEGEEKGEGEKSQKGGQQEDSLPFLNRHWLFLEGTSFEDRITINFASTWYSRDRKGLKEGHGRSRGGKSGCRGNPGEIRKIFGNNVREKFKDIEWFFSASVLPGHGWKSPGGGRYADTETRRRLERIWVTPGSYRDLRVCCISNDPSTIWPLIENIWTENVSPMSSLQPPKNWVESETRNHSKMERSQITKPKFKTSPSGAEQRKFEETTKH